MIKHDIKALSQKHGIPKTTLSNRIYGLGMSVDDAIKEPKRHSKIYERKTNITQPDPINFDTGLAKRFHSVRLV